MIEAKAKIDKANERTEVNISEDGELIDVLEEALSIVQGLRDSFEKSEEAHARFTLELSLLVTGWIKELRELLGKERNYA